MFDIFFGWRKASKCKKLIKRVQCRLKLLKNKRLAIARLVRRDIAELLKKGHEQNAFDKLQLLYADECILSVYDMLDQFSEFIVLHLSYIRRHKDIPSDINEAISTLIYASARCGDLPELRLIRELFGERYGRKFASAAVELHNGNLVNQQVQEKLSPQLVAPEDAKNRLLDEIVRDYFFKPGPLALKYTPDFHAMQLERVSNFSQVKDIEVKEIGASPSCSIVLQSSTATDETPKLPMVLSAFKYSVEDVKTKEADDEETMVFSSESPTKYLENSIIYLDDVEEFKSPCKQGISSDQDQRFFVFRSPSGCTTDNSNEFRNPKKEFKEMSSCIELRHSDVGQACRKRVRRRSISREKLTVKDDHCETYYGSKPHYEKKHRRKIDFDEKGKLYNLDKGRHRCSLDQPCYSHTNDNQGREIVLWREKQKVEKLQEIHVCRKQARETGAFGSHSQTARKLDLKAIDSPSARNHWPPPPYVRAETMPQLRELETVRKEVSRSSSLPVEKASPRHVHPKLPDYDDIAAKFMELKKIHQQAKCRS